MLNLDFKHLSELAGKPIRSLYRVVANSTLYIYHINEYIVFILSDKNCEFLKTIPSYVTNMMVLI